MTQRNRRDHLKIQLLEAQRLKQGVQDHPLMSTALTARETALREEIESIPLGSKEARTVLFFSGEPVQGSQGIDASFAGRVLGPFQSMLDSDYEYRWHGLVSKRSRRSKSESRLLLTALPRGSFGLELSHFADGDLFSEGQVADSLAHVTRLVEGASRSDEDFASECDETSPRVIQKLHEFLDVVAKSKAGLRIESGGLRCEMSPERAMLALIRVSETRTTEEARSVSGVLKGVLLQSWKYDFISDNDENLGGKLDSDLSVDSVIQWNSQFFNRACSAELLQTTVEFRNGRIRREYTLRELSESPGLPKTDNLDLTS